MDNLTRAIEQHLLSLLADEDEFIQLRRKDLAETFGCVPSQINYVLKSRFGPEQGYLIESRRGGSGYIKILKITCTSDAEKLSHIDEIVGDALSINEAKRLLEYLQDRELITARERLLIEVALRDSDENNRHNGTPIIQRRIMIADLMRRMLTSIMLS